MCFTDSSCLWENNWTDSGDRGAAQADHDRVHHADHVHDWTFVEARYPWQNERYIAFNMARVSPQPWCRFCGCTPN